MKLNKSFTKWWDQFSHIELENVFFHPPRYELDGYITPFEKVVKIWVGNQFDKEHFENVEQSVRVLSYDGYQTDVTVFYKRFGLNFALEVPFEIFIDYVVDQELRIAALIDDFNR